jgi:hypothetical protein
MIGHEYKFVDAKLLLVSIGKQCRHEKFSEARGLKQCLALRRIGSNEVCVGRRRGMVTGRLCHDVPQGLKPFCLGTTEVVPSRPMSHPAARRRTSGALGLRSLGLFQRFGQRGHDLENVADYAVIGDLENGRVLILVDGHNRPRALHSHDVLNGTADSQREI